MLLASLFHEAYSSDKPLLNILDFVMAAMKEVVSGLHIRRTCMRVNSVQVCLHVIPYLHLGLRIPRSPRSAATASKAKAKCH